jgi:hypothetical protein
VARWTVAGAVASALAAAPVDLAEREAADADATLAFVVAMAFLFAAMWAAAGERPLPSPRWRAHWGFAAVITGLLLAAAALDHWAP